MLANVAAGFDLRTVLSEHDCGKYRTWPLYYNAAIDILALIIDIVLVGSKALASK